MDARLGNVCVNATLVLMPEASSDFNDAFEPAKDNIRLAG